MNYLFIITTALIGFTLGRLGHIYFGQIKSLHHWIYGAIGIVFGLLFLTYSWGLCLFVFSLGLFVSDLRDFSKFRFYGIDSVKKRSFWNID